MRLYFEVGRATTRRMATYRGATIAGIFTNTVFGFILAYVLLAVFEQNPEIGGFDAVDVVTYTFVTQGLLMTVGIFGTVDIAERIKTGEVAVDLSRPYDFQLWWLAVAYGKAAFYVVARGVPPFLLGAIVLDLQLPEEWWIWPAFLVSVALAVGVAFAYGFILQLSAFWILDVRGPNQIGWLVAQGLSGSYVPLVLFPPALAELARVLPFASMIQLPVEIFLGKHEGADVVGVWLLQATWLAALLAAGRMVLGWAERRVVVQGG